MWLINTDTYCLEHFVGSHVPIYAILSHTWGKEADEVTFKEWKRSTATSRSEKRFDKIMSACARAREDGIEYIWVDTNCIDKSSSAELSEAINSMFSWYSKARICYVYLVDVEDPDNVAATFLEEEKSVDNDTPEGSGHNCNVSVATTDRSRAKARFKKSFCSSRWFLRGWTLQELVAAADLRFYTNDWKPIGPRTLTAIESMLHQISKITGIHLQVLLKTRRLSSCSVGERMSWLASRDTTREEDMAYCMMGIFGINMPLLYGEGKKAFQRLQEEIIRRSTDHSLFAWQYSLYEPANVEWDLDRNRDLPNLFAISPKQFSNFGSLINESSLRSHQYRNPSDSVITLTNVGVSLNLELIHTAHPDFFLGVLNLEVPRAQEISLPDRGVCCIGLMRVDQFYYRTQFPLAPIFIGAGRVNPPQQIHIPLRPDFVLSSPSGIDYAFLIAFPEVSVGSEYFIANHEVSGHMIFHHDFSAFSVRNDYLGDKDASYAIIKIGRKGATKSRHASDHEVQVFIGIRKTNDGIEIDAGLYEHFEPLELIRQRKQNFRSSSCVKDTSHSWILVVERGPTTHSIPTIPASPTSSNSDLDVFSDMLLDVDLAPAVDIAPRSASPLPGSEKSQVIFSVSLYKNKDLPGRVNMQY